MMTKVSDTRNFQRYRELLGLVAGEGFIAICKTLAQVMKDTDGLVIIEVCCDEDSSLRTVCDGWGITYFGISEKAEEASTVKWLLEQVDEERRQGKQVCSPSCSCPLQGHLLGTSWRTGNMTSVLQRLKKS